MNARESRGPRREEIEEALPLVVDAVRAYLERLDDLPARTRNAAEVSASFREPLPECGVGAVAALRRLIDGVDGTAATSGPRCFHFVIGGSTPAAFGADWLASDLGLGQRLARLADEARREVAAAVAAEPLLRA